MTDFIHYSHSQVSDFAVCERKHYFSYRENLTSRTTSEALEKGTIFHEALKGFYSAMQNGLSKDKCISAAKRIVIKILNDEDDESLEFLALELYGLIIEYADHYYDQDNAAWEILAVEQTFEIPELEFLFIPDLIVKHKIGKDKGKLQVVDFKTGKNFWSQKLKDTNPQIPKYLYALNTLPEYKGILLGSIGQIRTQRPKKIYGAGDWLRRDRVETTPTQLENIWRQHMKFVERIKAYEKLSQKEHFETAVESLTYSTCQFCQFSDICTMANQGRTFEVTKATQFKKKER